MANERPEDDETAKKNTVDKSKDLQASAEKPTFFQNILNAVTTFFGGFFGAGEKKEIAGVTTPLDTSEVRAKIDEIDGIESNFHNLLKKIKNNPDVNSIAELKKFHDEMNKLYAEYREFSQDLRALTSHHKIGGLSVDEIVKQNNASYKEVQEKVFNDLLSQVENMYKDLKVLFDLNPQDEGLTASTARLEKGIDRTKNALLSYSSEALNVEIPILEKRTAQVSEFLTARRNKLAEELKKRAIAVDTLLNGEQSLTPKQYAVHSQEIDKILELASKYKQLATGNKEWIARFIADGEAMKAMLPINKMKGQVEAAAGETLTQALQIPPQPAYPAPMMPRAPAPVAINIPGRPDKPAPMMPLTTGQTAPAQVPAQLAQVVTAREPRQLNKNSMQGMIDVLNGVKGKLEEEHKYSFTENTVTESYTVSRDDKEWLTVNPTRMQALNKVEDVAEAKAFLLAASSQYGSKAYILINDKQQREFLEEAAKKIPGTKFEFANNKAEYEALIKSASTAAPVQTPEPRSSKPQSQPSHRMR